MLKRHLKTQAAQWPPVAGVIGLFAAAGYVAVAALPLNAPAGAAGNNVAGLCADVAPFPFFDDFESGYFSSFWTDRSTGAGDIVVTDEHVPHDGTYHVTMDSRESDVYSLNELILCIDLSGKQVQDPFLSFRFTDFNDEAHVLPSEFSGSRNGDGVALSIGETDQWTRIVDLTSGSGETGLEYRVSLVDYAGQPRVQVKFQQFDNASINADEASINSDGIALDSIQVRNCNTSCDLGADTEICSGEVAEICANVADAIPPLSFSWNTGATTQCITTDASGTYQATVTDGVGCTGACVLTVKANPVADAGPDEEYCADAPDPNVGGSPTGSGGTGRYDYAWTGDQAICLSSMVDPNPTLSLKCAGPGIRQLCVEVKDANGCADSDCVEVTIGESAVTTGKFCRMEPATEPGILTGYLFGGFPPYACSARVSPPDSGWTVESCTVLGETIRVEYSVAQPASGSVAFVIAVSDALACRGDCTIDITFSAGCAVDPSEVCEGERASLCSVYVGSGFGPFTVEWQDPTGQPIPAASCTNLDGNEDCCLTTCNTKLSDAGTYTAIARDAQGFGIPCEAPLFVNPCEDCTDDTDCDDANPCTTDVCLPSDVCEHTQIECPGPKTCDPATGNCVQRGCESDMECDDGVYCNGTETCTHFLCQPGIDSCSDISGSIIQVEDDEACATAVTPLEGWEVRLLDRNDSLATTDGEGAPLQNPVCTDGTGAYSFTDIPNNSTYVVCEVVPDRLPGESFTWEPCLPDSDVHDRDVSALVCAQPNGGTERCYERFGLCEGTGGKDFNNFAREIPQADGFGLVFCDENGDEHNAPDPADPGLGDFCFVLTEEDGKQRGYVSDSLGTYSFAVIEGGQTITVREDIDGSDCAWLDNSANWVPTTTAAVPVVIPPEPSVVLLPSFGNRSIPALDCGTGDVTLYAGQGECQATFCFAATVENLCGAVTMDCKATGPDGMVPLSPFEDLRCGEFPADLPAATVVTCEATTEANREESCSFEVIVECVGACCADDGNLCDGQETCDSGKCVPAGGPCQPDEVCCQDGTGVSCVVDIQNCVDPPLFPVEWTSPESGNWSRAENWQPQVIPDVDSGFFAVTIPDEAHVTLDVSATVQDLHIGLGASIEVDPATGTTLELRVLGRIENRGEIRVQEGITLRLGQATIEGGLLATVGDAAIQLMEGTVLENVAVGESGGAGALEVGLTTGAPGTAIELVGTIDNQGQMAVMGRTILRPPFDENDPGVLLKGEGKVTLLAASDAKFEGAGTIACELVNDGTIVANSPGESLTLEPDDAITNNNELRAEGGGILRLNADVKGQGKLTVGGADSHVIIKDVNATFDSVTIEPAGPGATVRLEGSARVPIRGALRLCKDRPIPGALSLGICDPPVTLWVTEDSSVEVGGTLVLAKTSSVFNSSSVPMTLAGDFVNEIIEPSQFGWEGGLILDGSAAQTFEVAGEDRGRDPAGFDSNFAMGMVEVAPGAVVTFHDAYPEGQDPCAQALYVQDFVVRSEATVTVSDCTIYYKSLRIECDASVTLLGCGAIHPVRGDVDDDSDCDLFDYRVFQDCFTGKDAGPIDEGCEQVDFDGDHDVDLEDFSGFHLLFGSGPDRCTEAGYGLTPGR